MIFGGVSIITFLVLFSIIFYLFLGSTIAGSPSVSIKDKQSIEPAKLQNAGKADRDSLIFAFIDSISAKNEEKCLRLRGDRISIMITGLDARLGRSKGHADANHLINIWLDSAIIEIISIPRGTLVDVEMDTLFIRDTTDEIITIDTVPQNYISNIRYIKGRSRYLKEISKVTNTYGIDYYVEFGFSQAMGIMELLGYKDNSDKMLRILRSRKIFASGDYHRCYNQGQFIRQMILKHFNKLTGMEGKILLYAALMLTESNLSHDQAEKIIYMLDSKGFPRSEHDVIVRIMPRAKYRFRQYDFTDNISVDSLHKNIFYKYKKPDLNSEHMIGYSEVNLNLMKKLNRLIDKAVKDSADHPLRVISTLKTPFEQRIWFQVKDSIYRGFVRRQICLLLSDAYLKTGKIKEANSVNQRLTLEQKVFDGAIE